MKDEVDLSKTKGIFRPANDLVLVRPLEVKDRETKSGIILPLMKPEEDNLISNQEGVVIGVGPGSEETDVAIFSDVQITRGDCVIYEKGKGIPVRFDGVLYDYVRGWNLIGKLINKVVPKMPLIWAGRSLQPFDKRIFLEWLPSSDKFGAGATELIKPEQLRARSVIGRIITMGENMPKHFKGLKIVPGSLVLFDPFSRTGTLHNWKHAGKRYVLIESNDVFSEPLTEAQMKKLNYHGGTI